jgi:hypothetical protein
MSGAVNPERTALPENHAAMIRPLKIALLLTAAACLAAGPAEARRHSGKGKTCYALASPKERRPEAKRDAAYIFISDRPAEKVHNEVSIIMGFPLKETGKAEAKVGRAAFALVTKGSNAWIKNPEDEAKFVETLQKGGTLIVKAAAAKGPATVDSYALDGLKQALGRISKDCK